MAEQLNIAITNLQGIDVVDLEKWAEYTIEKWQRAIARYGLIHTGRLINSFLHYVHGEAGGDTVLIQFTFLVYLKFLDMGVGRGVPYHAIEVVRDWRRAYGKMKGNRRRPYPVYSRILYSEVMKLRNLLGRQWAHVGAMIIMNEFMHGGEELTVYRA